MPSRGESCLPLSPAVGNPACLHAQPRGGGKSCLRAQEWVILPLCLAVGNPACLCTQQWEILLPHPAMGNTACLHTQQEEPCLRTQQWEILPASMSSRGEILPASVPNQGVGGAMGNPAIMFRWGILPPHPLHQYCSTGVEGLPAFCLPPPVISLPFSGSMTQKPDVHKMYVSHQRSKVRRDFPIFSSREVLSKHSDHENPKMVHITRAGLGGRPGGGPALTCAYMPLTWLSQRRCVQRPESTGSTAPPCAWMI